MHEENLTYPCIVQLYPVELQRACCVQIIKLCLGRRQTAERDDDDYGNSDGRVRWGGGGGVRCLGRERDREDKKNK